MIADRPVFQASWQCLAHESQFAAPGDYVADTVAGVPVLIVRGEDGVLRAFRNACRHRLSTLVADGAGSCGAELTCPYHGWRYTLDGRLRAAVRFGALEGFDARDWGLVPLALKTWRGFVFVAPGDGAPAFDDWIRPVASRTASLPIETWRFTTRRTHDVACRWSVYVENYLEGYHVPLIHPSLDAEIVADDYRVEIDGLAAIHHAPLKPERRNDAVYDGLWAWLWPNLGVNVYKDGMMMERIWPLNETTTRLDYLYVFADPAADHSTTYTMSDAVTAEDKAICEAVERNVAAADIAQGPLSPRHEGGVHLFRHLLADARAR